MQQEVVLGSISAKRFFSWTVMGETIILDDLGELLAVRADKTDLDRLIDWLAIEHLLCM